MKSLLIMVVVSVLGLALPLNHAMATETNTTPVGNPEVREFAKDLCIHMMTAGERGGNIVQVMEDQFLAYLNITRDTPDYKEKIIAFWNANKNDFICKGKVDSATRETEHLMKRAVALSIQNHVLYKFLLKNRGTDVNAIEYVTPVTPPKYGPPPPGGVSHAAWGVGEPETLLDYLNKILVSPPASYKQFVKSDVKRLREIILHHFNAKTAAELMEGANQ
jgi:hypothetical protein